MTLLWCVLNNDSSHRTLSHPVIPPYTTHLCKWRAAHCWSFYEGCHTAASGWTRYISHRIKSILVTIEGSWACPQLQGVNQRQGDQLERQMVDWLILCWLSLKVSSVLLKSTKDIAILRIGSFATQNLILTCNPALWCYCSQMGLWQLLTASVHTRAKWISSSQMKGNPVLLIIYDHEEYWMHT